MVEVTVEENIRTDLEALRELGYQIEEWSRSYSITMPVSCPGLGRGLMIYIVKGVLAWACLLRHELTHARQQAGPWLKRALWGLRYLADPWFRLRVEMEAVVEAARLRLEQRRLGRIERRSL